MKPLEFLGPYRILGTIGRGGMGRVFRAEHAQTGEKVAVKLIADNVADDPRFRRRFADEVETLKRLKHPNIVRLIGYGEESGQLFYSMELVEGESLQERLKREKRLEWPFVVDMAIEVCGALKHAHDFGVIHRDLKPANLLLDTSQKVKLVDFGIAKLFGNLEQTVAGSLLGTADYMAPEQAGDGPISPRVDLYALGNVLYACFAGHPPFVYRSVTLLIESVRKEKPRRIEELNPSVPLAIAELIHDLLAKRPEDRPPTALAVMNRLKAIREGLRRTQSVLIESETSIDPLPTSALNTDQLTLGSLDGGQPTPGQLAISDRMTVEVSSLSPSSPPVGSAAPTPVAPIASPPGSVPSPVSAQQSLQSVAASSGAVANGTARATGQAVDGVTAEEAARRNHFQTVHEHERARSRFDAPHDAAPAHAHLWQWLSVFGMVAVLALGVAAFFYATREPGADELHAQLIAALDAEDTTQWQRLSDRFLRLYPDDPRAEQVSAELDFVGVDRVIRRLRVTAAREGGSDRLAADEVAFLDAISTRDVDPQTTRERLTAWLALFDPAATSDADAIETPDPEQVGGEPVVAATGAPGSPRLNLERPGRQRELIEAARAQLERLTRAPPPATDPRGEGLLERIRWAEQNLDGESRRQLLEGLVVLFADKPWARPAVNEARRQLDLLDR